MQNGRKKLNINRETFGKLSKSISFPDLFDDDVKQGDAMLDLEVFVHQTDRTLKVVRVLLFEKGREVVAETLVRKAVIRRIGGVLDPDVDEVQQLDGNQF